MTDMVEVVIKIPKEQYEYIRNGQKTFTTELCLLNGVCNGTVLPKGHERLIDADEAIKTLKSLGSRDYRREKGTIQEAIKMLRYEEYTPTIIPANEEVESVC